MPIWTDTELGMFTLDQIGWCRAFELPAFAVFPYGGFGEPNAGSGSSRVELTFEANGENDIPTDEEIAVARRVIANYERLLEDGITALFNDISGVGPDSGMWWHSNLEHVREIAESSDGTWLAEPKDLRLLLGRPSILIQKRGYGYRHPCAIICFEAVFEPEHGIGLLTDGNLILGTGYQMDVSPFE